VGAPCLCLGASKRGAPGRPAVQPASKFTSVQLQPWLGDGHCRADGALGGAARCCRRALPPSNPMRPAGWRASWRGGAWAWCSPGAPWRWVGVFWGWVEVFKGCRLWVGGMPVSGRAQVS
jgi:hypothetical protein